MIMFPWSRLKCENESLARENAALLQRVANLEEEVERLSRKSELGAAYEGEDFVIFVHEDFGTEVAVVHSRGDWYVEMNGMTRRSDSKEDAIARAKGIAGIPPAE